MSDSDTPTRHAVLRGEHDNLDKIRRYLPSNYTADSDGANVFIHGTDVMGWTMHDYVIPRLASGLYRAEEITRAPAADPAPHRDQWSPGDTATFTYGLAPDATSEISARLAHRSGEVVEIVTEQDSDSSRAEFPTIAERADAGALLCYRVRFPDGHEDSAYEDELTVTPVPTEPGLRVGRVVYRCPECGYTATTETDPNEWSFGHDCEV